MAAAADKYVITSRELLAQALEAVAQYDLPQASEKGWSAAAHMVKGLAENRGWGRYGDRQLYQATDRLAQESSDGQSRVLFSAASALYSNSSDNSMPRETVSENLSQISQFLDKLEALS